MNYFKIDTEDVCNGDGLRATLWLSGCSHHCFNCQNQETWNPNNGKPFDSNAENELFEILDKPYISGLTITGGDPLFVGNTHDVFRIVQKFRNLYGKDKTIWIYTGYTWEQIHSFGSDFWSNPDRHEKEAHLARMNILEYCDVLVDGKYDDSLRDITLKFRGSSNQRLIDIQKSYRDLRIVEIE